MQSEENSPHLKRGSILRIDCISISLEGRVLWQANKLSVPSEAVRLSSCVHGLVAVVPAHSVQQISFPRSLLAL